MMQIDDEMPEKLKVSQWMKITINNTMHIFGRCTAHHNSNNSEPIKQYSFYLSKQYEFSK